MGKFLTGGVECNCNVSFVMEEVRLTRNVLLVMETSDESGTSNARDGRETTYLKSVASSGKHKTCRHDQINMNYVPCTRNEKTTRLLPWWAKHYVPLIFGPLSRSAAYLPYLAFDGNVRDG